MYYIEKKSEISIAHRLMNNTKKCKYLHGHNLEITVRVKTKFLNEDNMVMDFSDLKMAIISILEGFDHCAILNSKDTDMIDFLRKTDNRVVTTFGDPTSERIADNIYYSLLNVIPRNLEIEFVKVSEGNGSSAAYQPENELIGEVVSISYPHPLD